MGLLQRLSSKLVLLLLLRLLPGVLPPSGGSLWGCILLLFWLKFREGDKGTQKGSRPGLSAVSTPSPECQLVWFI